LPVEAVVFDLDGVLLDSEQLWNEAKREVVGEAGDLALSLAGLAGVFAVTVSSEEVARGKPAPDVYLEVCRRLGVSPGESVAVEDSSNGLRSAAAAGMAVIAVPNPHYPPDPMHLRSRRS
jgi:beta-phosphoglucomutase-like phosphatase (HAD superfamily)